MATESAAACAALSLEDLLGRRPAPAEKKHAPSVLYARGPMRIPLERPPVSVIGARRPSGEGLRRARAVSATLVENGIVVVSGLAAGIDAEAHRTAIRLRGRTIAVLGTPLDRAYPAENAALQKAIAEGHLLLSQFAPGRPVARGNFVMRNLTMALVSRATVIVEAGKHSGTRHQGWEALRLRRPLFIADSVADDPGMGWPGEMLARGAVRMSGPEDVLGSVSPRGLPRQARLG